MTVLAPTPPRIRRPTRSTEQILDALVAEARAAFPIRSPHRIYQRGRNEALRDTAERLGVREEFDRRLEAFQLREAKRFSEIHESVAGSPTTTHRD